MTTAPAGNTSIEVLRALALVTLVSALAVALSAVGGPRALARARAPLTAVLHECAYSWSEEGWQRKALAAGHRAALLAVVRMADGVVVTKVQRERWLRGRRWLPSRPLARIPVCAPLQPPDSSTGALPSRARPRIGVLGFGADDARADIALGAARQLRNFPAHAPPFLAQGRHRPPHDAGRPGCHPPQ